MAASTSGDAIINNLKKGQFYTIYQDLTEYLQPLQATKTNLSVPSLQRYAYTTARILQAAVVTIDKCPDDVFHQFVEAVHLCCEGIKETSQYLNVKEPLSLVKVVYHLISRINKKDALHDVIKLSEFLYDQIQPLQRTIPEQVVSISAAMYPLLWNAAVKKGENGQLSSHGLYQLYALALRFYSVHMKSPHTLVEKVIQVVTLPLKDGANLDATVQRIVNLLDGVVAVLKYKLQDLKESSKEFGAYLQALLDIQQFEIRHFINSGAQENALEICKICLDFLSELGEKKTIVPVYTACCKLASVSARMSNLITENAKVLDTSHEIMAAVELLNQPAVAKSLSHFTVIETLLQLKQQIENVFGWVGGKMFAIPENLEQPIESLFSIILAALHQQKVDYSDQLNLTSDKSVAKKLQLTVWRRFDVMSSQMYLASGKVKAKQSKVSNSDCVSMVTGCQETLKSMREILDEMAVQGLTSVLIQRYHILIFVANKLAGGFYHRELYEEAVTFYKVGVETWNFICDDASPQGIKSRKETCVWIWHMFEQMSDCLRFLQQFEHAMDVVVQGLTVDPHRINMAVEAWYRIKREVIKREDYEEIKYRTLYQGLQEVTQDLPVKHAVEVLEKELLMYMYKHRMTDEALHVVSLLLPLVREDVARARVLLHGVQQIWVKEDPQLLTVANERVEEALELLQRNKQSGVGARVQLARACLWKYITRSTEERRNKAVSLEKKRQEDANSQKDTQSSAPVADGDILIDLDVYMYDKSATGIATLQDEADVLAYVEQAVECLSDVNSGENLGSHLEMVIEILSIASSVYSLGQQPVKELHCLTLLSTVLKKSGKKLSELLRTRSRCVLVLCQLGHYTAAAEMMEEVDRLERELHLLEPGRDSSTSLAYLLVKAEVCLFTNKILEGVALLEQAFKVKKCLSEDIRTHRSVLGWLHRLLAQYLTVPLHQYGIDVRTTFVKHVGNCSSPLVHCWEGMSHHSFVVLFLTGWQAQQKQSGSSPPSPRYGSLIDQWEALNDLLTSLDLCATLMMRAGEIRHCRYYLKEGLLIAYAFSLPKRRAEFLIKLGELHAALHTFTAGETILTKAYRILYHPRGYVEPPDAKTPEKRRKDAEDCFGFISEEEEIPIRSCYFTNILNLTCSLKCTCTHCQDLILQKLRFEVLVVQFDSFCHEQFPSVTEQLLRKLRPLVDDVKLKVQNVLKRVPEICNLGLRPETSFLNPLLARLAVLLNRLQLARGTLEGIWDETDFSRRALEMLDFNSNPDMVLNGHLITEVHYLDVNEALQQFLIQPLGGVDELTKGLSELDLDEERSRLKDIERDLEILTISDDSIEEMDDENDDLKSACEIGKISQLIHDLTEAEEEEFFIEPDDTSSSDKKSESSVVVAGIGDGSNTSENRDSVSALPTGRKCSADQRSQEKLKVSAKTSAASAQIVTPASASTAKIDTSTAAKIDTSTAAKIDTSTAAKIDTSTAAKIDTSTAAKIDTSTAAKIDTSTAAKIDTSTAAKIDTSTAAKIDTSTAAKIDTSTAAKITLSAANIDTVSRQNAGFSDSSQKIEVASHKSGAISGSNEGLEPSKEKKSLLDSSQLGSVISATYRTPARRRKHFLANNVDKNVTPAKQILKSSLKTPGRTMKKSVSIEVNDQLGEVDIDYEALAQLKQVFKTPGSVTSRRAALDILMMTDSDEEVLSKKPLKSKRTGTCASGQKSGKSCKKRATESKKVVPFDLTGAGDLYQFSESPNIGGKGKAKGKGRRGKKCSVTEESPDAIVGEMDSVENCSLEKVETSTLAAGHCETSLKSSVREVESENKGLLKPKASVKSSRIPKLSPLKPKLSQRGQAKRSPLVAKGTGRARKTKCMESDGQVSEEGSLVPKLTGRGRKGKLKTADGDASLLELVSDLLPGENTGGGRAVRKDVRNKVDAEYEDEDSPAASFDPKASKIRKRTVPIDDDLNSILVALEASGEAEPTACDADLPDSELEGASSVNLISEKTDFGSGKTSAEVDESENHVKVTKSILEPKKTARGRRTKKETEDLKSESLNPKKTGRVSKKQDSETAVGSENMLTRETGNTNLDVLQPKKTGRASKKQTAVTNISESRDSSAAVSKQSENACSEVLKPARTGRVSKKQLASDSKVASENSYFPEEDVLGALMPRKTGRASRKPPALHVESVVTSEVASSVNNDNLNILKPKRAGRVPKKVPATSESSVTSKANISSPDKDVLSSSLLPRKTGRVSKTQAGVSKTQAGAQETDCTSESLNVKNSCLGPKRTGRVTKKREPLSAKVEICEPESDNSSRGLADVGKSKIETAKVAEKNLQNSELVGEQTSPNLLIQKRTGRVAKKLQLIAEENALQPRRTRGRGTEKLRYEIDVSPDFGVGDRGLFQTVFIELCPMCGKSQGDEDSKSSQASCAEFCQCDSNKQCNGFEMQISKPDFVRELCRNCENSNCDVVKMTDSKPISQTEEFDVHVQSVSCSDSLREHLVLETSADTSISLDDSIEIFRADDPKEEDKKAREPSRRGRKVVEREVPRAVRIRSGFDTQDVPREVRLVPKMPSRPAMPVSIPPVPSSGLKATLLKAFHTMQYFPSSIQYRQVCQGLALCSMKDDAWETAYYLTESMNATIRHQVIHDSAKKRRRFQRDGNDSSKSMSMEHDITEQVLFGQSLSDFKMSVSKLPPDWVICQLTVVQIPSSNQSQLFLTRLEHDQKPIVMRLPGFSFASRDWASYLEDIVVTKNKEAMQEKNAHNWWARRRQLCDDVKNCIEAVEKEWFGCWKGLLLGQLEDDDARERVRKLAKKYHEDGIRVGEAGSEEEEVRILELVIGSAHVLTKDEVPSSLQKHLKKPAVLRLVDKKQRRKPVILILDRLLQRMPFESMPVLHGHPVCRMFSFHMLNALLMRTALEPDSIFNKGVDASKTFYVINPDGNLAGTEARLLPVYQEYEWTGLAGSKPTMDQYMAAISSYDMFVYAGHGSGRQYLASDLLQATRCRAATMLFGCSSALLDVQGEFEGTGTLVHYFLGGCCCLVGNLWDVTDKDVDLFGEQLFNLWLNAEPGSRLQDFIPTAREVCKMRHLVGSAPVCYGLPIHTITR